MKSKALHLIGKDKFDIREHKLDEIKSNEVLLKIRATGVCGTDLTYIGLGFHDENNSAILGHEYAGEILEIGSTVNHLRVGDRVVGEAAVFCGKCELCCSGNYHMCENIKFYGYPPLSGGFQEYLAVPGDFCIKMPDSMSFSTAVLVEPLAVCLHTLNIAKLKFCQDVAVIGCGPIGLMLIRLLKMSGVRKIFACDPVKEKQKIALKFGADFAMGNDDGKFEKMVKQQTYGKGVDRVFEAAGKPDAISLAEKVAKAGAHLLMVGIPADDSFNISHAAARKKGLTIKLVRRLNNTIDKAIDLLIKCPEFSEIITHTCNLKNAEKIILMNRYYQNGIIKSILEF